MVNYILSCVREVEILQIPLVPLSKYLHILPMVKNIVLTAVIPSLCALKRVEIDFVGFMTDSPNSWKMSLNKNNTCTH